MNVVNVGFITHYLNMPKKEITKQEEKKWITNPEKWITLKDEETFRKRVSRVFATKSSPSSVYKRWDELCTKLAKDKENFTKEDNKELSDIVLSIDTTVSHRLLMEAMREDQDRTAITEYTEDLIKEYDCNLISERSLCEVVALSYFAIMRTSRTLYQMHTVEYLSYDKNTYYALLWKELERQQRMYLAWLQTLRTLKSPFWGMKINAKNAFIGENQQFNNNPITTWENH